MFSRSVGVFSLLAVAGIVATMRTAEAGQTTVFVNYGGFDSCVVCGVVDYASAFNGVGMEDRTFLDPLPPGAIPIRIVANVQGTCDDTAGISIDGTFLGSSAFSGTGCACGSCFDGNVVTSATYPDGFPGWSYGGNQVVNVAATNIALDGVDVTIVYRLCGDGVADAPEACDTAGDSSTCDGDCTEVVCGDGRANAAAGEACDTSVDSASCDGDCTSVECGDDHINAAAGESCDDGNDTAGDGCSPTCQIEVDPGGSTSSGSGVGGGGDGGAGEGGAAAGPTATSGGGGDGGSAGSTGPTGPTAGGGPTAGAGPTSGVGPTATGNGANGAGPGGGERDDEADGGGASAAAGDGGAGNDAASAPDRQSGCGCEVAGEPSRSTWLGAIALVLASFGWGARRFARAAPHR